MIVIFIAMVPIILTGLYYLTFRYFRLKLEGVSDKAIFLPKEIRKKIDELFYFGESKDSQNPVNIEFFKKNIENPLFYVFKNEVLDKVDHNARLEIIKELDSLSKSQKLSSIKKRNTLLFLCDLSVSGASFEKLAEYSKESKLDVSALEHLSQYWSWKGNSVNANQANKVIIWLRATELMYSVFLFLKRNFSSILFPDIFFRWLCIIGRLARVNTENLFQISLAYRIAFEAKDVSFQKSLKAKMNSYLSSEKISDWEKTKLMNALAIVAFQSEEEEEFRSLMKIKLQIPINHRFELDFERDLIEVLVRAGKKDLALDSIKQRLAGSLTEAEVVEFVSSMEGSST